MVGWLSDRHRELIVESKWKFADSYSLGTTTAGTQTYTWPAGAVQFEWIEIGGVRYFWATEEALDGLYEGTWQADTDDGFYTQAADATGATKLLRLYPAPTASGVAITGRVLLSPADLDTSGSNPLCPDDLEQHLIDGAIATGELRAKKRPDVAAPFEQNFQAGVLKLTKRRRLRGHSGVIAMPVRGFHFR